jgi:hypothetical protein
MTKLQSTVKRGKAQGTILTPHRYKDGCYVVSKSRFAADQLRVALATDLPGMVAAGFGVRMSNQSVANHRSPSLIAPASMD